MAVSADGRRWFLLDASPDVHRQLAGLPVEPPPGPRASPVEGVVLTDAELDHTLGIVLLREGRELRLWATTAVVRILERDSRLLPVTRAFARVDVTTLSLDTPEPLLGRDGEPSGMTVEPFAVPGDPPRFTSDQNAPGHTVGLLVRDAASGASAVFLPGCGGIDDALLARLADADLVLFDGTFWSNDELVRAGIGSVGARAMGHVPISGAGGSLERLSELPHGRAVYTHINNTNPILLTDSPERRAVEARGVVIGEDGMQFLLGGGLTTITGAASAATAAAAAGRPA